MPELPEVEALADHLRRHAVGQSVQRIDVVSLSVLKTFDPPLTALHGLTVTAAHRWGKYLGLQAGDLHLIAHLSRAGWLRWSWRPTCWSGNCCVAKWDSRVQRPSKS